MSKIDEAVKIGAAFAQAEKSINQAAIDLFAVGMSVFKARNSGHFHPLAGQRAVERFGTATSKLIESIGEVARTHDEMLKLAKDHGMEAGYGELCPLPPHGALNGGENVIPLTHAA